MFTTSKLFRSFFLIILLCGTAAMTTWAQGLEGDWFYRGFYAEARGGPSTSYESNFDFGTFNFVNTGGDNYRVTVVDSETEVFDLALPRSGNTFAGVFPDEIEPGSVQKQEVRIILDGDYAYLLSLAWSTSTEAGLEGQSFQYNTAIYLLSRNAFPDQSIGGFLGEYAFRLEGQAAAFGQSDRSEIVALPSITLAQSGGNLTADYVSPDAALFFQLQPDALGFAGELASSVTGVAVDTPGLVINRDEVRRYVMAVKVNDTDVVWLQTAALMGTVNTGTTDQYFTLIGAGSIAGRATGTTSSAPSFTRNLPAEIAVLEGGDAFISAEVAGAPVPQYQWYVSMPGPSPFFEPILPGDDRFDLDFIGDGSLASSANLVVKSVSGALDGYLFRVEAVNSAGSVESDVSTLKVLSAPTARLPNLSVRTTLAAAQNLAVGFVMTGGSKPLLIRAVGPTLGDFGVGDAMSDPRIGFNNAEGLEIDSNDDWESSLSATFGDLGAFALVEGSKDAALRVDLSGLGTVSVNGTEAGTVLVEVYDIGDSNDTRLANVSARNNVGTGDNILIAGFVVTGDDPKNMLIRAVGPGLEPFIGQGFLVDPILQIFDADSNLVATNDNWDQSLASSFSTTGAFNLTEFSRDAAMVITLPPGAYTAQVSGADGGTGQAIVEIYELP